MKYMYYVMLIASTGLHIASLFGYTVLSLVMLSFFFITFLFFAIHVLKRLMLNRQAVIKPLGSSRSKLSHLVLVGLLLYNILNMYLTRNTHQPTQHIFGYANLVSVRAFSGLYIFFYTFLLTEKR